MGNFTRGVISVCTEFAGQRICPSLVNYSAESCEIKEASHDSNLLGYVDEPEINSTEI